ncbi:hypothetical protein C8R43DRAFT_1229218 [Mycena crocata]|nr:hypothetical protein C8R43DRAFT_1229218 [Mycena crocata]
MTSGIPALSPAFPVELERAIFRMAAQAWPLSIATFMLVWLEPLLYQTMVMLDKQAVIEGYPNPSWEHVGSKSSLLEGSVRHLSMGRHVPLETAKSVLAGYSEIEDLWIPNDDMSPSLLVISSLRLKRLYCYCEELFPERPVDFTHPLFSQITHLELFGGKEIDNCRGLVLIPHLTHLSFNSSSFLPLFPVLLDTCKLLQVLVILERRSSAPGMGDFPDNPRFVSMACNRYVEDWQIGARTGIDYWTRAEEVIAKRRSGEINCLQYRIHEDESLNIV